MFFCRCYSLRRLQAPTGEEFLITQWSLTEPILHTKESRVTSYSSDYPHRTLLVLVLAWSQGQKLTSTLPLCSSLSEVSFFEKPIAKQQYDTRYFQLLKILSINKVTFGSGMSLFPTSCNSDYNIAHLCTNKVTWAHKKENFASLVKKKSLGKVNAQVRAKCMTSFTNFPLSSTVIGFSTTTVTFCDWFVGCPRKKVK